MEDSGYDSIPSSPLPHIKRSKTEQDFWTVQTNPLKIKKTTFKNAHDQRIVGGMCSGNILHTASSDCSHKVWCLDRDINALILIDHKMDQIKIEPCVCVYKNGTCRSRDIHKGSRLVHKKPNVFIVGPKAERTTCFHNDKINCIETTADLIYSGSADGRIKIWTLSGVPVLEIDTGSSGIEAIVPSRNGSIVYAWSRESRDIMVFDILDYEASSGE